MKAIFLVNDGTILPQLLCHDRIKIEKSDKTLLSQLYQLHMAGYKIIQFITNPNLQNHLQEKNLRILELESNGSETKISVLIREFYFQGSKEEIKNLLTKTAESLNINLSKSWLIGNTLNDIEIGNQSKCYTVLLDNGAEEEWFFGPGRSPNHFVKDLQETMDSIKHQTVLNA